MDSQSWELGDRAVEKQQSAAAGAERLETWRDAGAVMEGLEPVRQWQPGGSVPGDEQGSGTAGQGKLVVRRLCFS